ncbi:MAG: ComEC/Rec2 family competence protein, partial [Desulfosalsimonadaceae bacterium]
RERDVANTLAAAGLAIVMIYPPALFSVSFQLSFTAVAAILFGLSATRPVIFRSAGRLGAPAHLISFTLVSFFAITGTTPLTMHYFNQAAFLGIVTNLLVIPVIGFLVVPLALFSVLVLLPLHPLPAQLGLTAASRVIELILPFIYSIGGLSWSAVKTVTPSITELCCIYTLLAGLLFLLKCKTSPDENTASWRKPVIFAVVLACSVLVADVGFWWHNRYCNTQMRATILDVGQGSAALLELPEGYRMLIDGGGFSSNAIFDMGKNVVAPFLRHRKISSLDAVVLSHPDADHLNGLLYIIQNFSVDRMLSTHQPSDSESYREFTRLIASEEIPHPAFSELPRHLSINGADIYILHPAPCCPCIRTGRNKNNCSLVLKACLGERSILFAGDIMAAAEAKLAQRQKTEPGPSVLIAPHHGSSTSSTPEFLDWVRPRAAVFSAGPQNRFHLPADEVLERYRDRGCPTLLTSSDGAVQIETNGKGMKLDPVCGKAMEIGMH